ncbi:hypothetical protein Gorai_000304, partial [Gossypium raimondii]|nr:hypothetical protein [Gossypium raimondii]
MSGALTVSEFATGANLVISNFGVGRVTKKVRRRLDLPVDIDDSTVDGNGQYLTVRPYSPNFSTVQDEVESQVVWVPLLGLPE